MKKTCICAGKFALDIIKKRSYPEGFVVGKRNKFVEELFKECVGNTCGNVATILPYLGVQTFPIAHFDESEQGWKLTSDLEHYGADTRFVQNSSKGGTTLFECVHKRDKNTGEWIKEVVSSVLVRISPSARTCVDVTKLQNFWQSLTLLPTYTFSTPPSAASACLLKDCVRGVHWCISSQKARMKSRS